MNLIFLAILFLLTSCSSSDNCLYIYGWGDYMNPNVIKQFEEKFGCTVVLDTFDSNEAMYAKLRAGASGYDLIMPSNYILDIMIKQEMLQKIDTKLIPNIKYIHSEEFPQVNVDYNSFGIPYMINYSCIAYRKDRIVSLPNTWGVFSFDRYRGRMTMLNDMRETLGAALKFLGYSANTTNHSEIEEAADLLIRWKNNLAKFESEQYQNGIASAEYLIVQGFNDVINKLRNDIPEIGFILPHEGVIVSIDLLAIPKDAPHAKMAAEFINYINEPAVAAENALFSKNITANSGAKEYLPREILNDPLLFPSKESMVRSELLQDVGDAFILYQKAWNRVKSSYK